MNNWSIQSQLTHTRDPGTYVKRRAQKIRWPVVQHQVILTDRPPLRLPSRDWLLVQVNFLEKAVQHTLTGEGENSGHYREGWVITPILDKTWVDVV